MAVDKKSDYYNPPQHYYDTNGQLKNFQYVDHDVKPKIAAIPTQEEIAIAKKELSQYRDKLISNILDFPPSICPEIFTSFKKRGGEKIEWEEDILKDPGVSLDPLRNIYTLTKKRMDGEEL